MTPDRKAYHHGDLKNALVEAGIDLLEAEGLAGLSLRTIAARVGVSHTAPKNHFGSRAGLLTAIATEGFRRHAAFMRAGLDPACGPKDRIRAAASGYVRFAHQHPHLFLLMFSPLHCDLADPELQAAGSESYRILTEICAGLDWDKADAPGGAQRSEMLLWSIVHGYATLLNGGQFGPGAPGSGPFDILDILPDWGFRPRPDAR